MTINLINRHDLYTTTGRIHHKLNSSDFIYEHMSAEVRDIDIRDKAHLIQDGIIFSGPYDGDEIVIYKFGAKKILQEAQGKYNYKPWDRNSEYYYWVPDLYFIYKKRLSNIRVAWNTNDIFIFSNLFSYSELSNTDIFLKVTVDDGKFIDLDSLHVAKICVGGSLAELPYEAMNSFSGGIDYFGQAINYILSSKGNTDLYFKTPYAVSFSNYLKRSKTQRYAYHAPFAVITEMQKDVNTFEEYKKWCENYNVKNILSEMKKVYNQE